MLDIRTLDERSANIQYPTPNTQTMAIDSKNLIDRMNVRTMKKDVQMLKGSGVVIEPEKTVAKVDVKKTGPITEEKPKTAVVVKPVEKKEIPITMHVAKPEKQLISPPKTKRTDVENQIPPTSKEEWPLVPEKNNVVIEQKNWEQKSQLPAEKKDINVEQKRRFMEDVEQWIEEEKRREKITTKIK